MRRLQKSTFRPALETAEARILTTAGISPSVAPTPGHAVVPAEAHHPAPAAHPASEAAHHAGPSALGHAATHPTTHRNRATTAVIAEAWVGLVNMTANPVNYRISLYPYENGKYLSFTISAGYPNPTQYRFAGLTASGPGSVANFKVQFAGTQPTALEVGSTQATAPLYSIFQGSNGHYYVIRMVS